MSARAALRKSVRTAAVAAETSLCSAEIRLLAPGDDRCSEDELAGEEIASLAREAGASPLEAVVVSVGGSHTAGGLQIAA